MLTGNGGGPLAPLKEKRAGRYTPPGPLDLEDGCAPGGNNLQTHGAAVPFALLPLLIPISCNAAVFSLTRVDGFPLSRE